VKDGIIFVLSSETHSFADVCSLKDAKGTLLLPMTSSTIEVIKFIGYGNEITVQNVAVLSNTPCGIGDSVLPFVKASGACGNFCEEYIA
jgi:hypothetical protein